MRSSEVWIATIRWVAAIVTIAVAWFVLRLTTGQLADADAWWLSTNWLVLFLMTAVVFWIVLSRFRRYRRDSRFGLIFSGLVLVHLMAHGVVISESADWKSIWTVLLSAVEGPAILALLIALGFEAEEP